MEKSNLITLLTAFNKNELKQFVMFVNSPLFNREKILIRFADILSKHFPEFRISKEEIFKLLYPGKNYNDPLMRNIISDMMKLAEQFLIQINLGRDRFYKEFFLIKELSNKKQQKVSLKKLESLLKRLDDEKIKDDEFYLKKFLIENEKPGIYRRQISIHHLKDENAPQIIENKLFSFMITVLRLNAYLLNKSKFIFEYKHEKPFLEEALSYLEKNPGFLKNNLYLNFYYNAIKLFLTEEERYYFTLREIADESYENLNETDKKNVYVVLTNYCSEKINKGELLYYKELFELYKDIIRKGAHYEGLNYISHILFKKVLTTALEVDEFDWARNFLDKYSHELNEIYRDNNIFFSKAYFSFKDQKYDEALEYLSKVEVEDSSYKEEIKLLEIKIFFEAGYADQFDSSIDSFRHYLNSNKEISERRKTLYSEFLNTVCKLFRIKEMPDSNSNFKLLQLKKEILENKYSSNKKWLLEKTSFILKK